jgi:hypothetical protein
MTGQELLEALKALPSEALLLDIEVPREDSGEDVHGVIYEPNKYDKNRRLHSKAYLLLDIY